VVDTRLSELAARIREFGNGVEPQRVLDDDALALAGDLFASVDGRPEEADPDVLHARARSQELAETCQDFGRRPD
jgi:hypothetical protein